MRIIKEALSVSKKDAYFEILTDCVPLRIWFVTDDILRIRAGFDEGFDEASYSLVMTAWESRTDELFKDERRRVKPASAVLKNCPEGSELLAIIKGEKLRAEIHRKPFRLSVYDQDGLLIHEDIPELGYREDRNLRRLHSVRIEKDDRFYGFGEKTGNLDKASMHLRMTQGDSIGYDPEKTDGLYKHIPFYIRLSGASRRACGLFYHTTSECSFDLGKQLSNYWHRHSTFSADSGDIDLFLINGPLIKDVIRRYASLTGTSVMLPKAALGYLGSSMYYAELPKDCDQGILDFIDHCDREAIPIDGFQLSSGYCAVKTEEGIKRCSFTWNKDRFPDPKAWFEAMAERGITVSANVKPGMLLVHPLMEKMKAQGLFIKEAETDEAAVGTWWGGPGHFVDFTDEKNREAWKQYLKDALFAYGCTSVWNDNCEYDSLADLDARVSFEGKGGTVGELKSVMANLMCLLSNEASEEADAELRPFSVCRAGHAGIQRYAQVWTGDNPTCWESLSGNLSTMLGMSLSGISNIGSDIGGFYGPRPESELLVRWVQHGIFLPRFSIHSTNTDNTVTEPWMYSDRTPLIREAIRLRMRLMPFLYSLMVEAYDTGLPMLRPLIMNYQEDSALDNESGLFMLGDSLLVANVLEKGAKTRRIRFPKGSAFYDLYTRERYEGGTKIDLPVDISSIPMFLTDQAILPLNGCLKTEGRLRAADPVEYLKVLIVPEKDASFTLYEDDGKTNRYRDGDFLKTRIFVKAGPETEITLSRSGRFKSSVKQLEFEVIRPDRAPFDVLLNGEMLPHFLYRPEYENADTGWYYSARLKSVLIKIPASEGEDKLRISFSRFDMIGM